jgi:hypothetical protein
MELIPLNLPTAEIRLRGGGPSGPRPVADREVDLDRLAGRMDPVGSEVRKFEQPWHKNAAYMFASGAYSAKAVANSCDRSYVAVLGLLKQPWFQAIVAEIQKENGGADIMATFKAECMNSLVTLIEIRDDKESPASVRRQSAIDILHQTLGKPTQRVETETIPKSDDPVAEVERLTKENQRLADRL